MFLQFVPTFSREKIKKPYKKYKKSDYKVKKKESFRREQEQNYLKTNNKTI